MFNKTEYQRNYRKEKLKRIPLEVSHDYYQIIKDHTEKTKESVNGFIKRAINETISHDNSVTAPPDQTPPQTKNN